jgi:hypothetical protein
MHGNGPSSSFAPGDSFTLKVALLHTQVPADLEPKRKALILDLERVQQIAFNVYKEFTTEIGADLFLAHHSEDHGNKLDRHCEPAGAYYVLFSDIVREIKTVKRRGLMLPANFVEARSVAFIKQWIRTQRFPGWEYLVGEPEKDSALEYLHQRLAGANGDEAWGQVEDLCLPGRDDSGVNEVFGRLQAKHNAHSSDLHDVRDLLLGADGLVARLVKLRREQN